MITFIASHPHVYTVSALRGSLLSHLVPQTRAITYHTLFAADRLRPGSYVFTDFERLHPEELRLAANFFRRLGAMPGFRVVNDPARAKTRYGVLRALHEAGLNDFDAYCADGLPRPRRFPVFLRMASDHNGPIGDLIHDQGELDARLRALETEGIPLAGVLAVEFCGERNVAGLYEKLSFLKVGNEITLSAVVLGEHWNVKLASSSLPLVTPEVMRDHFAAIRENRHTEAMRVAFELAGIEYGRADVGICGARLQVYEINTNPNITAVDEYISHEHRESRALYRARLGAMLHAIDVAAGPQAVPLNIDALDRATGDRRKIARDMAALVRRVREQSNVPPPG